MAWLGIRAHESHATPVAEALAAQPEIDYVVQTAGAYNVMAEAACRSSAELYQLLRRIRGMPGVQRTETFVYLNLLRQQFQWSLDGARRGVHARGTFSSNHSISSLSPTCNATAGRASATSPAGSMSPSEPSLPE